MKNSDSYRTKKPKNYYMHTIDAFPASFYKGQGVLFSSYVVLATSLRQIRSEQAESRRIRVKKGWNDSMNYGYKRVVLP